MTGVLDISNVCWSKITYTIYNFELKYQDNNQTQTKKRGRKRRITWFNPPFSVNVKTKIGDKFLRALDKCFPSNHPLHKIVNRNTVKIFYKCMPNMKQVITKHNLQVQKGRTPTNTVAGCNCRGGKLSLIHI